MNTEQRRKITDLVLNGLTAEQIQAYAAEKTDWELPPDDIAQAIAAATVSIRDHATVDTDFERGRAILRLNDLYARSLSVQDYKTCHGIQRELNALLAKDAPPPGRSKPKWSANDG
jgi:hypothetical protein